MPVIETNGATVHYEAGGDGPPLLLIAGLASDNASWLPVLPGLGKRFAWVAPDNRGSGRTRSGPFTFADFADDAMAVLDARGIAAADVVGHSMGGMIALDLATRHPARVRRVVFAASATGPEPRAAAMLGALARARADGLTEAAYLALFHPWLFAPGFFATKGSNAAAIEAALAYPHRQTAEGHAAQLAATAWLDLSARVADLRHPALVLMGADDILLTPAHSRSAFAALPDARFELLPNAAHALHWDAPDAFVEAVTRFLA